MSPERPTTVGGALWAFVKETVIVVGIALVLSLIIKTFLVQAFYIPSESMERTLLIGDRVMVSQLTPKPIAINRGDVVVFKDPGGWLSPHVKHKKSGVAEGLTKLFTFIGILPQDAGEHLIKRVIGIGGDHLVCCDADGKMTVNGQPVNETQLPPGTSSSDRSFDVTIPQGRLWVMGDNRNHSEDSRYHQDIEGGTIPEELVVGRAVLVIWPFNRMGTLSNYPETYQSLPGSE